MANNNTFIWIVIAIVVLIVAQNQGYLDFSSNVDGDGDTGLNLGPSDQETTITLNTKDALATTDTDANVSYYVFNGDGSYLTTGTTSAGTDSFTVDWNKDYSILTFSDSTYYLARADIKAEKAQQTVNMELNPVSNATINKFQDPVDLNGNVSVGLGQQVAVDLLYSATVASSAINAPVIVADVNQTSVQDVSLGGLSKTTCPARLSVSANRKFICFQDTTVTSAEGIKTLKGSILFSSSTTPTSEDYAEIKILDTQAYAEPNYANTGISGIKEGTENPNDLSNVGATDSQAAAATDHASTVARVYYGG